MTEVTPHPLKTQGFHHFLILLFYDHLAEGVLFCLGPGQGRGAAPFRSKSRQRRAYSEASLRIALGRCAPSPPRDFPPRESHQSAPGALPIRAGSPRTPVCPKDKANRPHWLVPRCGHVGLIRWFLTDKPRWLTCNDTIGRGAFVWKSGAPAPHIKNAGTLRFRHSQFSLEKFT